MHRQGRLRTGHGGRRNCRCTTSNTLLATNSTTITIKKHVVRLCEGPAHGGFAYHATMPTDGLATLRDVMKETEAYGFDKVRVAQLELGKRVRSLLAEALPSTTLPIYVRRTATRAALVKAS
jgi:hypothetical protein